MSGVELSAEQAAAVAALQAVLEDFAAALELVRDSGLSVVEAFRLAGIEVPSFVPDSLLEGLLSPA